MEFDENAGRKTEPPSLPVEENEEALSQDGNRESHEEPPVLQSSTLKERDLYGKLHPLTIFFAAWNSLRSWIVPILILTFVSDGGNFAFYLLFVPLIATLMAMVRYTVFSYRLEDGELITRDGLIEKRERNIPLNRVQDVRLEQGILHRMFGVADVFIETAGGSGPEASLSVLAKHEAERLRAAVFASADQPSRADGDKDEKAAAAGDRELIRHVSLKELALSGLTSNRMASILVVFFAGLGFVNDLLPQERREQYFTGAAKYIENWLHQGGRIHWGSAGLLALGVIGCAALFSVAVTILLFNDFKLFRKGGDLQRSYGLATKRLSSLPLKRIQIMKVEENWMRRLLNLATVRVDTAGVRASDPGDQNKDGRDVLLPILPSMSVDSLVAVVFPGIGESQPDWRRVSPRMIVRSTFKAAVVCALLTAGAVWYLQSLTGLWTLLLIPLCYIYNRLAYRHLGYSREDQFFRTRRGWFSRSTRILPVRNIQSIVLRQNPFDRRHKVWTLQVDSAGQAFTGGGPELRNVPSDTAENLALSLAKQASHTRYRV